jgi:hypothetical protein
MNGDIWVKYKIKICEVFMYIVVEEKKIALNFTELRKM